MSDLIKREDARSDVICLHTYQYRCRGEWLMLVNKREVINAINAIPSADRPRGEWIDRGMRVPSSWVKKCSLCGYETDTWRWCNYCPNCGAKMDGADDE